MALRINQTKFIALINQNRLYLICEDIKEIKWQLLSEHFNFYELCKN
jgi:hypothetical protein